jgi:hypothetical protein
MDMLMVFLNHIIIPFSFYKLMSEAQRTAAQSGNGKEYRYVGENKVVA